MYSINFLNCSPVIFLGAASIHVPYVEAAISNLSHSYLRSTTILLATSKVYLHITIQFTFIKDYQYVKFSTTGKGSWKPRVHKINIRYKTSE